MKKHSIGKSQKLKRDTGIRLSVVLATYNEEGNIAACLEAIQGLADEVILMDGESEDETRKIARKMGAKIYKVLNRPDDFHYNKQLGIEKARGRWVLQLDADEVVSPELRQEIASVVTGSEIDDGATSDGGATAVQPMGYALPRRNWFLGRYLTKGGAYPDPVVRLFVRGKGRFPDEKIVRNGITTGNVHAQIEIDGAVGQLTHDLIHYGDPELARYLKRFDRYTTLEAKNLYVLGVRPSVWQSLVYLLFKPTYWFGMRYGRHRGYEDGFQGFLFALFSALHYPMMYLKVWEKVRSKRV